MNLATSPVCIGINAAVPTSLATTNIAGHEMVEIPKGHAVIRSGYLYHNNYIKGYVAPKPRWVSTPEFFMAEAVTNNKQYYEVMKGKKYYKDLRKNARLDDLDVHPAEVSYLSAIEYLKRVGGDLILPLENWWEVAARGPAKNVPELMEEREGRYIPADVVDYTGGWLENFVFEVGGEIFTDPKGEAFQRLIGKSPNKPFYGWYAYGSANGHVFDRDYKPDTALFRTMKEVWSEFIEFMGWPFSEITKRSYQPDTASFGTPKLIWHGLLRGTAPVKWGRPNAYGLYNMTGNVCERVRDPGIVRGGDWDAFDFHLLMAGYRRNSRLNYSRIGFRVAAPASAVK